MAVHEEVAQRVGFGGLQPLAEAEQLLDVLALRHHQAGGRVDDVVEAQRQPLVRAVGGEVLRLGVAGVEDGEDVGDGRVLE